MQDGQTVLKPDENGIYTIPADMDDNVYHNIYIRDSCGNTIFYLKNKVRWNTLAHVDTLDEQKLPHGAVLSESLPATVTVRTAASGNQSVSVPVKWDEAADYVPAAKREQHFTVTGTLDLSGTDIVVPPEQEALQTVTVEVTVAGAPQYRVTAASSENGTVTVVNATETAEDGTPLFCKDDLVMLSIAPNEGYMLSTLSINGTPASFAVEDDTYTFAQPEENVTITATFEKRNEHTITFDANGGSEPEDLPEEVTTAMPAKKVLHGSEYCLPECEFIAPEGKQFKAWQIGDSEYAVNDPVTVTADITVKALWKDSEKPTGEIKISENSWKAFLNNITFGLFFKDTQTVTITAADNSGETVTVEYLLSAKELTKAELDGMTFTAYTAPFGIDPDNEYIIYVRLTDTAGNTDCICSDGIVLDGTSPVITGIEDGKTYCEAQTVTITEKYVDTVTVNGTEVTLDENGSFVLSPADGGQKIVVTDKAGNTAEMSVTVNDGHTFGEWTSNGDGTHTRQCTADGCTEGVETDNCIDEDKNHICDICGNIISNHADANQDHVCDLCGKVISNHEDANKDHVCDLCGKVITNHAGGKETCRDKAVCEICGKSYGKLDPNNHTDLKHFPVKAATEDSEGNIEYWYCSGCNKYYRGKDGTKEIAKADTVTAKLPKSPPTGDNSNLMLWIALLFISGGVVTGTTVISKKKKHSAE